MRRRRLSPAVALLLLLNSGGTPRADEDAPACEGFTWRGPREGTNLVLVVNDTMRRDRPGAYGGPARTPAFDGFAAANLRFENAFSQAPWTSPSIATLFTSLYPSQHGVTSHPDAVDSRGVSRPPARVDILPEGATTLAEVLGRNGRKTAAFVGNPWMEAKFGFAQGFQEYDLSFAAWDLPGEEISRAALKWLSAVKPGETFFLYLHYMDSHRPYPQLGQTEIIARKEEWARDTRPLPERGAQLAAKVTGVEPGSEAALAGVKPSVRLVEVSYDRGVEQFDRGLQLLLEGLSSHRSYERTAIVITSDHGESLFDRGFGNHGRAMYDDELAVPLAARLPEISSAEALGRCRVGLIDLMPTLCTYLGLDCPEPMFGASLLAPRRGAQFLRDRYIVSEGVMHKPWNRSLRGPVYKLLWQPDRGPDGHGHMLFDVRADPGERTDLLDWTNRTPEAGRMFSSMTKTMARAVPDYEVPGQESVPLSPEERERLKALGYVN